jgi:hypothetical protein
LDLQLGVLNGIVDRMRTAQRLEGYWEFLHWAAVLPREPPDLVQERQRIMPTMSTKGEVRKAPIAHPGYSKTHLV